jgi:hypothetical protein
VGVDAKREAGVAVPQILAHRPDRFAAIEKGTGKEVPECVAAVLPRWSQPGCDERRFPDVGVEVVRLSATIEERLDDL